MKKSMKNEKISNDNQETLEWVMDERVIVNEDLFPINKPLDEERVKSFIDIKKISYLISMNEHLDINFIRKYKEYLDWEVLSSNFKFSESELLEFSDKINWTSALYCQEECTEDFVKENNIQYVIDNIQSSYLNIMNKHVDIENVIMIRDSNINRDDLLSMICFRIKRTLFNEDEELIILFEDNKVYKVYKVKSENLLLMERDIKTEIVTNDTQDILKSIRNIVEEYSEK